MTYQVFDKNVLVRTYKSKRGALEYIRNRVDPDQYTMFRVSGDRLMAGWDHTGWPLQFISHGGDHGEWRTTRQ